MGEKRKRWAACGEQWPADMRRTSILLWLLLTYGGVEVKGSLKNEGSNSSLWSLFSNILDDVLPRTKLNSTAPVIAPTSKETPATNHTSDSKGRRQTVFPLNISTFIQNTLGSRASCTTSPTTTTPSECTTPANEPICANPECRACEKNSECKTKSEATPACVTVDGVNKGECVACTENSFCQIADSVTPFCDTGASTCRACQDDTECEELDASTPVCATSGKCVSCKDNSNCKDESKPICNTEESICKGCSQDSDCAETPATPACVTAEGESKGKCVACTGNTKCTGELKFCSADNICVECTESKTCTVAAKPVCKDTKCAACSTLDSGCKDKDATKPTCQSNGDDKGQCVAKTCEDNDDCTEAEAPICDTADKACKPCTSDSKCKENDAKKPKCQTDGDSQGQCVEKPCESDEDCKDTGEATECKDKKCVKPDLELCTIGCDLGRPVFTVAAIGSCAGSVAYSVISGTGDQEDSSTDDSVFYDSDYTDNNERQRRQADEDKDIIQTALAPSTVCPVS